VEQCGAARHTANGDIIWRMSIAWWVNKATDTHLEWTVDN